MSLLQIPGDMVVNSMLVAMALHSHDRRRPCDDDDELIIIYQFGSSIRNPMNFKQLKWFMYKYLTKNPMLIDNQPIKVGNPTTLSSMTSFRRYIWIRYVSLLKVRKLYKELVNYYYL